MVIAAIWVLLALLAQERTPEQLIHLLRSERIQDRETAVKGLRNLGERVVPLLLTLEKDGDVEVARRATDIIKDIQDPLWRETAAESFQRMEEKIRGAKTLSVRLKQDYQQGNRPADLQSQPFTTIKLKGESNFWAGYPESPKKNRRVLFVSNGTASWPLSARVFPGGKEVKRYAILGFTKLGTSMAMMIPLANRGGEPEEAASLSDFSLAGHDSTGRIISYRITFNVSGIAPGKVEAKLWCDPKTRLPKKRILTLGEGPNDQQLIEIYESWEIDSTIPDETFMLPDKEPQREEFYRNLDVVEPHQVSVMHGSEGVECVDGFIQRGSLTYDGRGASSERYGEFISDMAECGWTGVPDKTNVADGHAVMRKGNRTCTAKFSGNTHEYTATIKVDVSSK